MIFSLVVLGSLVATSQAAMIIDTYTPSSTSTPRSYLSACHSPGSLIQVSSDTTINGISVLMNNMGSNNNLTYVIFDEATETLLYQSAAQGFAADASGSSWKDSDAFTFTLQAGSSYAIGAISDTAGLWDYDFVSETQNGLTSVVDNPTFENCNGIMTTDHGIGDAAIRLTSADPSVVPEPASIAIWSLTLGCFGFCAYRKSKKS